MAIEDITPERDEDDPLRIPFNEWTPCEMHGHLFSDGRCVDCGELTAED